MRMNKEERMLLFQKREKLFMAYCDEFGFPQHEDKIRFCDIDPSTNDDCKIYSWFYKQNLNEFKKEVELYKDIYPKAYACLKNRLLGNPKEYKSRLEAFMRYVDDNGWVSERSKVRFCDIDEKSKDTANVGIWYAGLFRAKGELVKKFATQNEKIYPTASQEIISRFEKTALPYEERLKLVMQYIEEFDISEIEAGLTFADLGELVSLEGKSENNKDTAKVKKWFERQNRKHQDELKKTCILYKERYSKASAWIIDKIEKLQKYRNQQVLSFQERTVLYLSYLNQEQNEVVKSDSKLKFSDLPNEGLTDILDSKGFNFPNLEDPVFDETLISSWLRKALVENIEELANECLKYKKIYPLGFQKLQRKIDTFRSRLSTDKRVSLFMQEVEANGLPIQKSSLRFCDLDPSCKDESVVGTWFAGEICYSRESFIVAFTKYRDTYPCAYEEIKKYINCSSARLANERARLIGTLRSIRDKMVNLQEASTGTKEVKSLKRVGK